MSCGDFSEDLEQKLEVMHHSAFNNQDIFERTDYFESIFPSLRIQKPGYDLYGSSTMVLTIVAVYIFIFYS